MELEADYYELQPRATNNLLNFVESAKGLTLPYHTYYIDRRTTRSEQTNFVERIPQAFENLVACFQIPKNTLTLQGDFYSGLKWSNADDASGKLADELTDYLVNFDGSQFYNLRSNQGQSGSASHVEGYLRAINSDLNKHDNGVVVAQDWKNYQVLGVSFERSNTVKDVNIVDSGVDAVQFGQNLNISFRTADAAPIPVGKQVLFISKFTRTLQFQSGSLNILQ